jgi:hypothetical protein
MRAHVACTALGVTLAAAIPAAHAQTVYDPAETEVVPAAPEIVAPPVLRTVRTVTTTTTTHALRRPLVRRRAVIRHNYVTSGVAPATTTTTTTVATMAQAPAPYASGPLYDTVVPPATVEPYDTVPLYDTVAPPAPPAVIPADTVPAGAAVPAGIAVPAYRYVYQDDRILVIDPSTGIAVEAIPR